VTVSINAMAGPAQQELRHLPVQEALHEVQGGPHDRRPRQLRHPGGCRKLASTAEFQETYRQKRPMIERTIAWLVRGQNRRLRYIGTEKNRIWLAHWAAAVNLMRMLNLGLSHDGSTWLVATAE
jgi:hypothetical protein